MPNENMQRRAWHAAQCNACRHRELELLPVAENTGRCTAAEPGRKATGIIFLGPDVIYAKCPMFHWIHEDCTQNLDDGKDDGI